MVTIWGRGYETISGDSVDSLEKSAGRTVFSPESSSSSCWQWHACESCLAWLMLR